MADEESRAGQDAVSVETVLSEFDAQKDSLEQMCSRTKRLIEACLEDAHISYQSVQTRVKSREKLRRKYENPAKNYKRLDDITDLAGLRVITYYEDDVDNVAEVIRREFEIDTANTVDRRQSEPDRFGYHALNFVCEHSARRIEDVEYKKFSGVRFEVQVTSILRHAWSEIEHDWYDLKDLLPDDVRRRFARMAALLEIAESEFLSLRKMKSGFVQSVALQVEAKVPGVPLDHASLRAFVEQDPLASQLDVVVASHAGISVSAAVDSSTIERLIRATDRAGLQTVQSLRSLIEKQGTFVREYLERSGLFSSLSEHDRILVKGWGIFHLIVMLVARDGEEALYDFLTQVGISHKPSPIWNVGAIVAASRFVASKQTD